MENENKQTGTETDKKTGGTDTQTVNKNEVVITQEKLDSIISQAFAKGAKKGAENNNSGVDMEIVNSLKGNVETLQNELLQSRKEASLQEKINVFEVEDQEVFKLLVESNEKSEDFDIDTFTKNLRETRPSIFKQEQNKEEPKYYKTDSSNNKQEVSFSEKLKGLSLRELEELSKKTN